MTGSPEAPRITCRIMARLCLNKVSCKKLKIILKIFFLGKQHFSRTFPQTNFPKTYNDCKTVAACQYYYESGLDIGYVPAGLDAFFRWSGQSGPQQFILWWPVGPEAIDLFFFFFCSQCCKCTLTEPHAPKMHVHTPSTANAFSGHNIEDLLTPHPALVNGLIDQMQLT